MRLLSFTWKVYGLSIWLYPPELREMHGEEMREAFRQQTLEAQGGFELLGVLGGAALELFTCALPLRAQSQAAIVGAASVVSGAAITLLLLGVLHNPIVVKHAGRGFVRAILQAMN